MSDALYNFSNKADNEEQSLKLNMDELYIKKQQQDLNLMNNYNKILGRVHNKIKYVSKQLINEQCCWYLMPEMLVGIPKYNCQDCTAYIIEKLRDNGFIIRYTHPNLLFISWKHWIPSYVRNEIKKKTGNNIDEYGNIINNNINENNNIDNNNFNNTNNSNNTNDSNYNTLIMSNKSNRDKINDKKKSDFKDIKSYNPSGSLIYSNNLLKKLDINI
tara:strand:+ start:4158 stop:4805 length:648 start_codon:yes stop_codon:yes gene_type:complete